ncbi:uncharacterized protein MYCFIDRAFT_76980 [Pseudocercospora fijiensis CIRAD86]|uniref:F-box domain-containing protein n=1 Tax=Pseudocercospora fijiensis (strain CIRAD86) TaxID=383855 RepID=M2ZPM9_PSEFD|nr:uncharacterized protein MYCFIDRAFT_76980 [Pseudocercospora fijiensis CIRAD86]EME81044.1 hypothetical protein MYCFIDRAFT_76980 [Pseudocercospora fijiensis CIRAD86]
MASPSEPPECYLTKLAPEIRNLIYEYSLCNSESIEITRDNWMQPALLRTCKTIRREATGIYYCKNTFEFECENFDSSIPLNFWRYTSKFYDQSKLRANISCRDCEAWPNFLNWLKAYFEDRLPFHLTYNVEVNDREFNTAAKAFDIVYDLRNAGNDWNAIEKVLESYKVLTADVLMWDGN